nr:MAG TPA: hypothetical protein [Caudoviricetes sp.]DAK41070.1 MAG TPA: hypothetical protein [Caudoviricetes sp.]
MTKQTTHLIRKKIRCVARCVVRCVAKSGLK